MSAPENRTKEVNRLLLETVSSALHAHARPGVHGQVRIEAPRVRRTLHFRVGALPPVVSNEDRNALVDRTLASLRSGLDGSVSAVVAHFQDGRLLKFEVEDEGLSQ